MQHGLDQCSSILTYLSNYAPLSDRAGVDRRSVGTGEGRTIYLPIEGMLQSLCATVYGLRYTGMRDIAIRIPYNLLKEFCQRWKIRERALFGSVLRDDVSPDSDIDIL